MVRFVAMSTIWVTLTLFIVPSKSYAFWFWTPGDTVDDVGYKPTQPIKEFSHKLHAGLPENGGSAIDCQYCHNAARRSSSSGVPPLGTCMNCHNQIATGKESIKKIQDAFEKKESIAWTKVHDLPDYGHFAHNQHIQAGMVCQECHGPVETMDVVEQRAPLQMGWCIECHKAKKVSIECITCHY